MQSYREQLEAILPVGLLGSVVRTAGMTVEVAGFPAPIGALVEIERQSLPAIRGEVIGFRDHATLVYPFQDITGTRRGNRVRLLRTSRFVAVGDGLLGRVIDAEGRPLDGQPRATLTGRVPLNCGAPAAVERPRIDQPIGTGVRVIDGLLTCGRGQRMGIFSGSGVGKSSLLAMMARYTDAEVIVIALIGERGREVNEFIERDLGRQGLQRSVVVVATSDEPALTRVQAALTATSVAEYFRDQGKDVLFLMDSITRFATAQREIGLASGEPPTTRGYPPSVFSLLPRLVERTGRTPSGSITAFYSVLVEGDDTNEPISDTVRGLLDGHTILSRQIAGGGHYPAVDVLESISRLMPEICTREQLTAAQIVRQLLAAHRDHEDLISIGAYRAGSNRMVDVALALHDDLNMFRTQTINEHASLEQTRGRLLQLGQRAAGLLKTSPASAGTAAAPARPTETAPK